MKKTVFASATDCVTVNEGSVRFYDNYVPSLGPGDYLLNVSQRVNPTGIDDSFVASQVFSVVGPRFALPPEDIMTVFPPSNARGVFEQFLPNVVLTKRDLPWERNVFDDADPKKQTPWMALLLFIENEQIGGSMALLDVDVPGWKDNPLKTAQLTAYDMVKTPAPTGTIRPELEAEWYETDDRLKQTGCTVIDVSPQAFATLVPNRDDLRYLSHVRQVDPSAKDSAHLQVKGDGWYSVVVSNRLPDRPAGAATSGVRNIAHLVSLEGLEKYVGGATAFPAGTSRVRMISFASWSFTCLTEPGESFAGYMSGLLTDVDGTARPTSFTLATDSRAPSSDAVSYARDAIASGRVPMRYQTRLGEETFAWYRGPFSPMPVTTFITPPDPFAAATGTGAPAPSSFNSGSGAIVYDKARGIFDVSYGVAWETGRLLALSDGWFGQTLLSWQRQAHRIADRLMERGIQRGLNIGRAQDEDETLLSSTRRYALVDDFVINTLSKLRVTALAAPRSIAKKKAQPPLAFAARQSPLPSAELMTGLLSNDDVRDAVLTGTAEGMQAVTDWLAKKYLLEGVPFEALVPHAALLPPESVRFFHIDENWLAALIDGALSIGLQSTRDRVLHSAMRAHLHAAARGAAATRRLSVVRAARGLSALPRGAVNPAIPVAGMLLRSGAIPGWPGLEVHGYSRYDSDDGTAVPDLDSEIAALRIERLGESLLIALWSEVPAAITIDMPSEGIAFGFEDPPAGTASGDWLFLRSLEDADGKYGKPLPNIAFDAVQEAVIDPTTHLVKITGPGGLVPKIQSKLAKPGGTKPDINVRDLATQLIKVPERAVFAAPQAKPAVKAPANALKAAGKKRSPVGKRT